MIKRNYNRFHKNYSQLKLESSFLFQNKNEPNGSLKFNLEGLVGFEPTHQGVAVPRLTTWL